MDLATVQREILSPAYDLLPVAMNSYRASIMLLSIGLQESRFVYRKQIGGPGRGFWQFEKGGGVRGVLTHSSTTSLAELVCSARGIEADENVVYNSLASDDILAACFARMLLWTDPKSLPNDDAGGWALYARTWRPGKPHPETWGKFYEQSKQAVMG